MILPSISICCLKWAYRCHPFRRFSCPNFSLAADALSTNRPEGLHMTRSLCKAECCHMFFMLRRAFDKAGWH